MQHSASTRSAATSLADIISKHYTDINGQRQTISEHTRQQLIAALGEPLADNAPVPPVRVLTDQQLTDHQLHLDVAGNGDYHWTLTTEQGKSLEGDCTGGQQLVLTEPLPQGYHLLTLHQQENQWQCRIIIAPQRCYQPAALMDKKKFWGLCIQLYTLRSLNNWGVGDFGDLQKLLRDTARQGGAFVGLNPLHALYPAQPDNASPYSPSSRRWLNIIYIDVNAVEDFQINPEAEKWWALPATQKRLSDARDAELVDYPAVMALKLAALSIAFRQFSKRKEHDDLMRQFRQFVREGGDALYWHAVYDALHQWLMDKKAAYQHWGDWSADYQHHDSQQVSTFCRNHADDIEFHCWLQWLAQRQLAACWNTCQQAAMAVGLYRDLAVGVAQYSADTWYDRSLYCMRASIGAPPDPLGPQGQNWQLPPMNPQQLIARAYQPFIDLLRANMRCCGALRIDHVMSLMRLWWIPENENASAGAYVHYPLDDLLAILALESQRHQCMIIGEDLGLVPPAFTDKLRDAGIYSYKVMYFERDQHQQLPAPADWQEQALATISTHDLPTMQGYWQATDLTLNKNLGIYPDDGTYDQQYRQRQQQKHLILASLLHHHCLPERTAIHTERMVMTPSLCRAFYRYMASCRSALFGVQPEDWLDIITPVNIPGTDSQYPNWRRKLNRQLEELFIGSAVSRLIATLNKYRKQLHARKKYHD